MRERENWVFFFLKFRYNYIFVTCLFSIRGIHIGIHIYQSCKCVLMAVILLIKANLEVVTESCFNVVESLGIDCIENKKKILL